MKSLNLWKYNKITGMWNFQRSCTTENAMAWLEVFQKAEPNEDFKLSYNKPN